MNKTIIGVLVAVVLLALGAFFLFHTNNTYTPSALPPKTIVAFGDSLVSGVGATYGNDFVSLLSKDIGQPIINLGVPGNTTADGLGRLEAVIEKHPDVVIVLLGGNDALRRVPTSDTFANLKSIIKELQASGAKVLLLGIQGNVLSDPYEKEFKSLAKETDVAYVSNVLEGLFGNAKYMSDTIHPSDLGYRKIADRVRPVLTEVLSLQ